MADENKGSGPPPVPPKQSSGSQPEQQSDLGKAAKDFWAAAKAKAQDLGGKAKQAATDYQAQAKERAEASRARLAGATLNDSVAEPLKDGTEPNATPETSDKPVPKKATWLAGGGCLALVSMCLICGVCGGIGQFFWGPIGTKGLSVDGSDGSLQVEVSTFGGMSLASHTVAESVYWAAKKHPEMDRLRVTVELTTPGGWQDKYGEDRGRTIEMGSFTVTDLDEVRRYKDGSNYGFSNEAKYVHELRRLRNSHHLSILHRFCGGGQEEQEATAATGSEANQTC